MAPQGHGTGATSREGACENSNLERQGCIPFYQDLIDDPYVDPVSGCVSCLIISSSFLLSWRPYFSELPKDTFSNYSENCLSRSMTLGI